MSNIIFEAVGISKVVDKSSILKDIDLSIIQGETVAIVGHNGSGKSSLLKLIGSIYEPSKGTVNRFNNRVGYVPEHFPENIRFKMKEYLLLVGEMNGRQKKELSEEINHYAKVFNIAMYLETPLRNCSKGTKQKVGIIQSLIIHPNLLLLDEPLTGLDEDAQNQLLKQLILLKNDTTIVFTTHENLLIEELADRIITVENGEIIESAKVKVTVNRRLIKAIMPNKDLLLKIEGIDRYQIENGVTCLTVFTDKSDQILLNLLNSGCSIIEVKEKR